MRVGVAYCRGLSFDGLCVGPHPRGLGWLMTWLNWCVGREDIDYRFRGLGLCTLAVLLLYALGWIGRS